MDSDTQNVNAQMLQFMIEAIDRFQANRMSLHQLISDLDQGKSAMIEIEKNWRKEFDRLWLDLEIANAHALDGEQLLMIADCDQELLDTLTELQRFLKDSSIISG